jgi:glycosyltransferase involved in cell wall biosynthesis
MQRIIADEPRVKWMERNREPKGACTCRNIGVERSNGKYLIFLDTDDLLAPHCLEQRVAVMEQNPQLDLAIFPSEIFNRIPGDAGRWWNIETERDLLTRQFHQDAICQGTGCIWRKSSFIRIGLWAEHLAIWQDIDLFLRAWIQDYKVKVCFDHPPDLFYREHNSLSRSGFYARPKVESRCRVIQDAVRLLDECGLHRKKPLARFMVGETVYGAASGRHFDQAQDLLNWAAQTEVLQYSELKALRRAIFACRSRMTRFSLIRNWIERQLKIFHAESLLGKIPRAEPLRQLNPR